MKRTSLAPKSKSEVTKCKDRIQDLLRAIRIVQDGGCVLWAVWRKYDLPECNGYRTDGELILQYDHLNSRERNISYADIRLGVILCKGHHGWKHFTDRNTKRYNEIIRELIGPDRAKLWSLVETDRKTYRMELWDWQKVQMALKQELAELQKAA
jgi:hypothetical protein